MKQNLSHLFVLLAVIASFGQFLLQSRGNVLAVNGVHLGMTEAAVVDLLGQPELAVEAGSYYSPRASRLLVRYDNEARVERVEGCYLEIGGQPTEGQDVARVLGEPRGHRGGGVFYEVRFEDYDLTLVRDCTGHSYVLDANDGEFRPLHANPMFD